MKEKMYERILTWLEGTMTPDERSIFEDEMRQDKQLAAEVELAKSAIAAQQETEVMAMRKELRKIMQREPLPGKNRISNGHWLTLALIVLAGLALLFFLFSKEKKAPTPKRMGPVAAYQKYFSTPNRVLHLTLGGKRTETEEDSQEILIGQRVRRLNEQLTSNNLPAALESLDSLEKEDPTNKYLSKTELLLLEGILQLKGGEAEVAITLFDKVEQIRPNEEAQWYRTGALLSSGRAKEAISQLESIIAQPGHPKKKEATELLQNLDK